MKGVTKLMKIKKKASVKGDLTDDTTSKKRPLDVEITNTSQLNKPGNITTTGSSKSDSEGDITLQATQATEWNPGALVLAHLQGYPYWAAVVTEDKSIDLFRRDKDGLTEIHVDFLGSNAEHAWIKEYHLIKYGHHEFRRLEVGSRRRKGPNGKQISAASLKVPHRLTHTWNRGMKEARKLEDVGNKTRLEYCAWKAEDVRDKHSRSISSKEQSGGQKKNASSRSKKIRKPSLKPKRDPIKKPTKGKLESASMLFYELNGGKCLQQIADIGLNKEETENHLRGKWDTVTPNHKIEYVFADYIRQERKELEERLRQIGEWVPEYGSNNDSNDDQEYAFADYIRQERKQLEERLRKMGEWVPEYGSNNGSNDDQEELDQNREEAPKLRPKRVRRPPKRFGDVNKKDENLEEDGMQGDEASVHEDETQHENDSSLRETTFSMMNCGKLLRNVVCQICEKGVRRKDELWQCKGKCQNYFHRSCLENTEGRDFQYADCHCRAAGSFPVTPRHILYPKHIQEVEGGKRKTRTSHVTWCCQCSKGGILISCGRCRAAFHHGCLDIKAPKGSFICEDCRKGKVYMDGDIVWAKPGNYRWWPGRIIPLEQIPTNILALKHGVGEIAVKFFGTHDFYWFHRGKVVLYKDGNTGGRKSQTARHTSLERDFQRALVEAQEAHKEQHLNTGGRKSPTACHTSLERHFQRALVEAQEAHKEQHLVRRPRTAAVPRTHRSLSHT